MAMFVCWLESTVIFGLWFSQVFKLLLFAFPRKFYFLFNNDDALWCIQLLFLLCHFMSGKSIKRKLSENNNGPHGVLCFFVLFVPMYSLPNDNYNAGTNYFFVGISVQTWNSKTHRVDPYWGTHGFLVSTDIFFTLIFFFWSHPSTP